MSTRTRRVAIDNGFSGGGNSWYQSGDSVGFPGTGHVTFSLPFSINLGGYGGNYVSTVTLWANGVLSLGDATQAQQDFYDSGASPITIGGGPEFPGFFFLFGCDFSNHSNYSYGLGVADYEAPYYLSDAVNCAFFELDNSYQIILDANGFSVLDGSGDAINGYYIGGQNYESDSAPLDYDYYPDFLIYNAGNYIGSEFGEKFISAAGADVIDGKDGLDLLTYEGSSAGVTVNLATGAGSGGDAQGDQIHNIEDLYGSAFADTLTGTGLANSLRGLAGNDTIAGGGGADTIEGGAGADNLDGGAGVDTLSYLNSSAAVTVSLADSTATGGDATGDIFAGFEKVIGSQFDDLLRASAAGNYLSGMSGDDVILGSTGADHLYGGYGDDFLLGGAGADTLDGEYGSDTVSYADSPAALTINLGSRTVSGGDATGDHIQDIENVIGTVFADVMTGSDSDNRLEGGSGDDTLHGHGGADILLGEAGADNLSGEDGNDTLFGGPGDDILNGGIGGDVLSGGTGADTLTGVSGNDILTGGDGNDVLNGGTGADSMTGGGGDDLFLVDNPGDVVMEGSADGTNDRILTTVSYALGPNAYVERLEISGSASTVPIDLTGNGMANTLIGNSAANVLNGRGGADYMVGNGGDDTFIVDNVGDVVVEHRATDGNDRVNSSVTFQLPAYVEQLVLTGTASINGTGNGLDNSLTGNSGSNVLDGGAGADYMVGNGGDDTFIVNNVGDVVLERRATDGYDTVDSSVTYQLTGNVERLVLTGTGSINGSGNNSDNSIAGNSGNNALSGSGGADTLIGGDGNDTLSGGLGHDILEGDNGKDVYRFADTPNAGTTDTINGYVVTDDVIHLEDTAFTGLALGALAPGAFHIGTAATEADDRIIYDSTSGALYFDPDGSGATAEIQFATLSPGLAMTAGEFFVI